MPDGHPVGFSFYMAPDGCVENNAGRNRNGNGDDYDAVVVV